MSVLEQLKREKYRAIAIMAIELILGGIIIFIGFQFFVISEIWHLIILEMAESPYTPKYIVELFSVIRMLFIVGGIFAFIYGVKRIVDNVLNAWVKSATPKPSEEKHET